MKKRYLLTGPLAGLMTLGLALGPAGAADVKVETTNDPAAPPTNVIIQAPAPTTVTAPNTMLQADDIEAKAVRAQTIYANKIKADQVQGNVHQTKGVKVTHSKGDIKVPEVTASVIYADVIKANSVVADNIYVREMERR